MDRVDAWELESQPVHAHPRKADPQGEKKEILSCHGAPGLSFCRVLQVSQHMQQGIVNGMGGG